MYIATIFTHSETWDQDTVLTTRYTSLTLGTDIIYKYNNALPGDQFGKTICTIPVLGTKKCAQYTVEYNATAICYYFCYTGPFVTQDVAESFYHIACYETGHTVGLMHGSEAAPPTNNWADDLGCLIPLETNPAQSHWLRPFGGFHNVNQVNAVY